MEQLQLQVESRLFEQDEKGLAIVRIVSRGEEEMNVIIALLVVTRGMWLGNVTVTRTGVVDRETVDDYSGGTRNSRQQ